MQASRRVGAGTIVSAYAGRVAILATMHGKEATIAPALRATVGLDVRAVVGLDTDQLGTFTGDIPRVGTMLEVAIRKARLGMAISGLPLGLASEGSFGPHPSAPFVPVAMELLVFVDDESGLVIHESLIDAATNFAHAVVRPGADMTAFLERAGFPSHALIVRPNAADRDPIVAKGVIDRAELEATIALAAGRSLDGQARLETDMRAHQNPTRLASLGVLATRLGRRLACPCPSCSAPGWGPTDVILGLPCAWCDGPTDFVTREVFSCVACGIREERPRSDGLTRADPGHCPECNP